MATQQLDHLVRLLIQTGIVQLGQFAKADDSSLQPMLMRFDLLPSYPQLLRLCVDLLADAMVGADVDRIFTPLESIGPALGLSLKLDIPVVYGLGQFTSPIRDYVGAYDVGHPTAIVLNDLAQYQPEWLTKGRSVGLEIRALFALTGRAGMIERAGESVRCHVVMSYEDLFDSLASQGYISQAYATQLNAWHMP